MRRLVSASVALVAIASAVPAVAADMKMPVKAPPPPIVLSWTGCYFGLNAGGGLAHKSFSDPLAPVAAAAGLGSQHDNGWVAGGQIGCDYQAGVWVFGVRGMLDGAYITGQHLSADVFDTKIQSFATAVARLGVTVTPNVLLYAVGGGAWVRDKHNITDAATGILEAQASTSRSGWVAGFGAEVLTQDGWSMFLEYDYMGFGRRRTDFINLEVPPVPPTFPLDVYQDVQVVMVGFNYRFGWAGPIKAKY